MVHSSKVHRPLAGIHSSLPQSKSLVRCSILHRKLLGAASRPEVSITQVWKDGYCSPLCWSPSWEPPSIWNLAFVQTIAPAYRLHLAFCEWEPGAPLHTYCIHTFFRKIKQRLRWEWPLHEGAHIPFHPWEVCLEVLIAQQTYILVWPGNHSFCLVCSTQRGCLILQSHPHWCVQPRGPAQDLLNARHLHPGLSLGRQSKVHPCSSTYNDQCLGLHLQWQKCSYLSLRGKSSPFSKKLGSIIDWKQAGGDISVWTDNSQRLLVVKENDLARSKS